MANDRRSGDQTHNKKFILIAAAFGGVAANLLKVGMLLTAGPVKIPTAGYILSYTVGLIILAIMGAATALMLRETSIRKAFFIGMGLPTLFQMSTTNYSTIHAEADKQIEVTAPKDMVTTSWSLIGMAYADSTAPKLPFTLTIFGEGKRTPDRVTLYLNDQKSLQLLNLSYKNGAATVSLPVNVDSFTLHFGDASSEKFPITSLNKPSVHVTVKERSINGLWSAIGVKGSKNFDVKISKD